MISRLISCDLAIKFSPVLISHTDCRRLDNRCRSCHSDRLSVTLSDHLPVRLFWAPLSNARRQWKAWLRFAISCAMASFKMRTPKKMCDLYRFCWRFECIEPSIQRHLKSKFCVNSLQAMLISAPVWRPDSGESVWASPLEQVACRIHNARDRNFQLIYRQKLMIKQFELLFRAGRFSRLRARRFTH